MSLFVLMSAVIALSGVLLIGLTLLFRMPITDNHRIREEPVKIPKGPKFWRLASINSVLSISMIFGLTYLFYAFLFHEEAASPLRMLLEGVGILITYDFAYYLVHRYLFHQWGPLKSVHAVHHTVRYPTAYDSLYMHPLENAIGVLLLMLCTFLVGPVSIYSFVGVFVIYSSLNILNHAGLDLPFFPFRTITALAQKHDKHHVSMRSGNYASITPLFDVLFGTAE
jgi:sterol desaturase/sphingolipid hydroxylase (fatty acid hydroxylase superfamily)